jgi:hypothetical protein
VRVESGLLPEGIPGEGGYLGWDILVAWRGVACLGVVTLTERLVTAWD